MKKKICSSTLCREGSSDFGLQDQNTYNSSSRGFPSQAEIEMDNLEILNVFLNERKKSKALLKIKKALHDCKILRFDLKRSANKIIDTVTFSLNKALASIQIAEFKLSKLCSKLVSNGIESKQYAAIKSISLRENPTKIEKSTSLYTNISRLFEVDSLNFSDWTECNEAIFSEDYNTGLQSINLSTLKLTPVTSAPKISPYAAIAKIDKEAFFVTGGYNGTVLSSTFIVNMKRRTFQTVGGSTPRYLAGSVCKDNKVYIFGGSDQRSFPISSCETFNLRTNCWNSIAALPQPCHSTTATVLGHEILISGKQMDGLYSFDGRAYNNVLKLPAGYKVVADKWVVTESELYEALNTHPVQWIRHRSHVEMKQECLLVSAFFRKNTYLYFIVGGGTNLYRIDVKHKRLDRVDYHY